MAKRPGALPPRVMAKRTPRKRYTGPALARRQQFGRQWGAYAKQAAKKLREGKP